jgi:hypothetical protein
MAQPPLPEYRPQKRRTDSATADQSSQRIEACAQLRHQHTLLPDGGAQIAESRDEMGHLFAMPLILCDLAVERRETRLDSIDESGAGLQLSHEVIELRSRGRYRLGDAG